MTGSDKPNSFKISLTLFACAAFIFAGRFTIPGRPLSGWPGFYESFAHILLGIIAAIAWLSPPHRRPATIVFVALGVFEIIMFKIQNA